MLDPLLSANQGPMALASLATQLLLLSIAASTAAQQLLIKVSVTQAQNVCLVAALEDVGVSRLILWGHVTLLTVVRCGV